MQWDYCWHVFQSLIEYLPKIVCNFLEDESVQITPVDNAGEGVRQYMLEKEKERENHLVSEGK